ncbi:MAG: hypothetical protein A3C50_00145 [Candidatus Staskawiczbacteria bacterium RIFCSPHIGHO2_02_FULL_43_16]|uniref:HU domain-containing protein n=1 Tax=Candidatus Staskawiczbacteria bacterium RIFCSPHIGHO2_01_FULL_41_41 TaxID=1802203 RepID=A0A1G2HVM7_9BACT|nr:MAG: hypothetical protein A2822_01810 [Candidatus Staskawiczbacteria bacterium RIFCSPHIGHO2_01_FULL_41_41]OGZ68904.1 MAG: hypothetical protein A3C50_00145 [Candidatus Staskawiczbacteria bacterium RIFCSPHIGHO2_02_FULL_43_16]OGZ74914.1 MAG: hypothetical protein A3A12_03670 [Candidatus Staskawiczbacteria bacterium RIFCSPLOWO2_01_FULL_43_17b]
MIYDMAWKPDIGHLKSKELLNRRRFYRLLSEQSNFVDHDLALIFYTGLLVLVHEELRQNKFCRLPGLGDFVSMEQKRRPAWCGKAHLVIEPRQIIKFYPAERLRRYFGKRQGFPRYSEVMPPKPIQ